MPGHVLTTDPLITARLVRLLRAAGATVVAIPNPPQPKDAR